MEGKKKDMEEKNNKNADCADCNIVEILTDEIIKLQKDNERLLKEQDFMFLALDLFLEAVKLWGQQNGLIHTNEDLNNNISSKVSTVFNQFGKEEVAKDKVMALLTALANISLQE